uniref:Uncharacterized protein n=1 Tax=Arundo donax TaxID=35708 RepID=A0A0A9H486_ARUDO
MELLYKLNMLGSFFVNIYFLLLTLSWFSIFLVSFITVFLHLFVDSSCYVYFARFPREYA